MSTQTEYLLDTNILSETRKRHADQKVIAFVTNALPSTLYLSVLTLGELRKGVVLKVPTDLDAARGIADWIDGLELLFADRILGIDAPIARLWGELAAERPRPVSDTLLAATAIVRNLTLVTRNTADIEDTGVRLLNPFL